jgi:hypothetical protein
MARIGIAQLEAGRRKPIWESVIALSRALGVACEAFMVTPQRREKPKVGRPVKGSRAGFRSPFVH